MSKLDELRERLYRRKPPPPRFPEGEGLGRRMPRPTEKFPAAGWPQAETPGPVLLEKAVDEMRSQVAKRRRKIFFRLAAAGFVALAAAFAYFLFFKQSSVEFLLLGPDRAEAGAVTTLIVSIRNTSGATLTRGSLAVTYGSGVVPTDSDALGFNPIRDKVALHDLPSGEELRQELRVRLFGQSGETRTVSAVYVYQPSNVSSELLRKADFTLAISRVPVAISIDMPPSIASANAFEATVSVDSEASTAIEAAALAIDFPSGFTLMAADPAPAKAGLWELGRLSPGAVQKITLRGIVTGEPEEVKPFKVRFGRYAQASDQWLAMTETTANPKIASPFLFARTTLNDLRQGAFQAGEQVSGKIVYKNNLNQKVENVVVTLSLPEPLVAFETLNAPGGFYDATAHELTWNTATFPKLAVLAPGDQGEINFSFSLKSTLPIQTFADKNFSFPVATTISSASVPPELRGVPLTYQDQFDLKIESRLALSARATFYDGPFLNHGPLPPQVSKATTYAILWQLSNTANDVKDVTVKGVLAGGVKWANITQTSIGAVAFNQATGEVTWTIPRLPASSGLLRPSASAAFQVELIPAANQVGTAPVLISGMIVNGTDAFTNTEVSASAQDLNIEITTDARSTAAEWRVVK